jgi:hypothetical protein
MVDIIEIGISTEELDTRRGHSLPLLRGMR